MFKFLSRLFGFEDEAPSTNLDRSLPPLMSIVPPQKAAHVPMPPPVLARIEVALPADRAIQGTLRCIAGDGSTMGGPWDASGYADEALATAKGNPARDPLMPSGHAPTGDYYVDAILPARVDLAGISIFGRYEVIRLVPVRGDAAMADSNGRTSCLIHGGDEGAPSDGSIRVSDEAMAGILHMLPRPVDSGPRILVEVREVEVDEASSSAFPTTWYDDWGYADGDSLWNLYWQMYMWDAVSSPEQQSVDDSCPVADPYGQPVCPDVPVQDTAGGIATDSPPTNDIPTDGIATMLPLLDPVQPPAASNGGDSWDAGSGSAYGR